MFTKFHYILLHSFPTKRPFSFLGLPRQGAHSTVRAPPPSDPTSMAGKQDILSILRSPPIFLLLTVFLNFAVSFSESDAEILLKFKESLKNAEELSNWDASKSPCKGWNGILCDGRGHVWGIQLENMGLHGVIDVETLAKLRDLRSVSIQNNDFEGPVPNWARLGALKTVFLSNNKFSGEIPSDAFSGMLSLKKLHLANNKFSGSIPATLGALPRLIELTLQNNEFEGEMPNFQQDGLKEFNVSNNKLSGEIPSTFAYSQASSFSGNKDLCGAPLQACTREDGSPSKGVSMATVVVVAIVAGAALLALVGLAICLFCRKKTPHQPAASSSAAAKKSGDELSRMERGQGAAGLSAPEQGAKQGGVKLTFLKENVDKFEMQDLLKASAEVLGSGAIGSTYKAALDGGKTMVVKRCKHMNSVSREDFNEHMRRLGRLNHQNVQPIVAFYFRKEEKLLVSEYAQNLSLAVRLHGNRSRDNPSLDWATRLNIVKGVAKGLLYLYNELPSLTAAHGHLKSSNVLLDASYKPLLADYGLTPIVNKEHGEEHLMSYKSPEFKESGRLSKKSDVWNLGVLILETLTGKEQGGNGVGLEKWVESAIRDESGGISVVLDKEMAGASQCHGEMMKLLNIGLSCCHADVERRPEIKEAVDKIEEIKEKDFDDDFYSSYASESDMRSSRGLSDDFKSINI